MDSQAAQDQLQAACKSMAQAVALFHKELRDTGFGQRDALFLTAEWLTAMVGRANVSDG